VKELIVLEEVNAVEIFQGQGMPELLDRINKEARSLVADVNTEEGRAAIKKNDRNLGKCIKYLDGKGKDIVTELKKQPKIIDGIRKQMRDFLTDVRVELYQPVSEYEKAEAERVQTHKNRLNQLIEFGEQSKDWMNFTISELEGYFEAVKAMPEGKEWEEFEAEYETEFEKAYDLVGKAIDNRKKADEEAAELEALRAAAAEREKEDRDAQIKKDAEEAARLKIKAEEKANSDRIEQERLDAIKEKETAELRLAEQQKKAAQDLIDAEARIKREAEQKAAKEKADAEKREANKKHNAKINNAAAKAIISASGITKAQSESIIVAIAKGKVPNVKISY